MYLSKVAEYGDKGEYEEGWYKQEDFQQESGHVPDLLYWHRKVLIKIDYPPLQLSLALAMKFLARIHHSCKDISCCAPRTGAYNHTGAGENAAPNPIQ